MSSLLSLATLVYYEKVIMPYNYKFHFYKVQKYPSKVGSFYSHTCHLGEQFHNNNNNKNITYAYEIAHHKIMQMHSYFFYLTHLGIMYRHP